jgi:hypothetical protein
MQTIGFDRSYIRFRIDQKLQSPITVTHAMPTTVNNVRINVECRCEVIELASERSRVYLLGASCKTERVGASSDCWLQPNADFCLVASEEEFLTIKSWASNDIKNEKLPGVAGIPLERQSGLSRDAWPEFRLQVKAAHGRPLTSVEAIIAAIQGDRPLVARTEFTQDRYRVIIDQPVKTVNYSERENVYQTDTGPIILPDLSPDRLSGCEHFVECFDLAYSTFNSAGWTEFIVNVRTPVSGNVTVNHYSESRRIEPSRNQLIEVVEMSEEQRARMEELNFDRVVRNGLAGAGASQG